MVEDFEDFLSKISFFRQSEIIYDRIICSFTISFLSKEESIAFAFSFFLYMFLAQ